MFVFTKQCNSNEAHAAFVIREESIKYTSHKYRSYCGVVRVPDWIEKIIDIFL